MKPTCRQSRNISLFAAVLQLRFNKLEKNSHDSADEEVVCCAVTMVVKRYTQDDVIFPTILSSLCLPLPPTFIILFLFFFFPQCNLIRLDCPLATSLSNHVALYLLPIPAPPSPSLIAIPLEWKWADWCPAILYHSTLFCHQLVASVLPYSQVNQSDSQSASLSLS